MALTKPIIAAHYMSWFQTLEFSRKQRGTREMGPGTAGWGFWQVNRPTIPKAYWHYPDRKAAAINGDNTAGGCAARDIASVFYPVIGPYDSADPDLCEYHILLAKIAGIDAFIADWYGPHPSAEHPYDNIGFTAMRRAAERLDFKVMICWEDRSMFPPISKKVRTRSDAIKTGQGMLRYLEREWFSSPAYLRIDGLPVLTNFAWGDPGRGIKNMWLKASEWNRVCDAAKDRPLFIHDWQPHRRVNEFEEYDSVMPWGSAYHGHTDAIPDYWRRATQTLKSKKRFSFLSGTVLPGFDNRGCGGWGTDGAIGITDRRFGEKFRATWHDVRKHDVSFIQVVTWNDFNEGGTIEPVAEIILHRDQPALGYGYRELETVQANAAELKGFKPDAAALRLPARIYKLRKKKCIASNRDLDTIRDLVLARRYVDASRSLEGLGRQ